MAFDIFLIPHDDESARSWMQRIKAFRLFSLQVAPDAFLSTYAREVAFTDDVWYGRLTNPDAFTFVALQSSRVVGSLALVGPLPSRPEERTPLANPWLQTNGDTAAPVKEPDASHWRINGMFVLPEARGQGVAKGLIEKSIVLGREMAVLSGKEFIASIAVDDDNLPAKSLYEKCGFVTIGEETLAPGSPRTVLLMKYIPEVGTST
jgi:GNAT superfamily N-acetyltransferase